MTGCQSLQQKDAIVFQDLKLGFRTEVEFTERTQYSIQPLGAELSCNVHTVHLQTGMNQGLAVTPLNNILVSLFSFCFWKDEPSSVSN